MSMLVRMVSILHYTSDVPVGSIDQTTVSKDMSDVQHAIKLNKHTSIKLPDSYPYVEIFPSSAADLPDEVRDFAYNAQTLPPVLDIPDLDFMLGGTKVRGHRSTPKWMDHVPKEYQALFAAGAAQPQVASPVLNRQSQGKLQLEEFADMSCCCARLLLPNIMSTHMQPYTYLYAYVLHIDRFHYVKHTVCAKTHVMHCICSRSKYAMHINHACVIQL
jgi:hypothetical protein